MGAQNSTNPRQSHTENTIVIGPAPAPPAPVAATAQAGRVTPPDMTLAT